MPSSLFEVSRGSAAAPRVEHHAAGERREHKARAVFGGQPFAPTFSGTYSINADCTGTKTITINGQPSHYALVLVDGGHAIETAETDAGTLLALTQVRQ
jgi:hypothetical protein